MKFYALVIWRTRGVIPSMLQLVYLGNAEMLRYEPDEADLLATERKVEAVWEAIRRAEMTGDWRPRKSRLCDWCSHQAICPEFGGTPPPLPIFQIPPAGGGPGRRPRHRRGHRRPALRRHRLRCGPERGLGAVAHPDPGERRGQVRLHGALGDPEATGDLLVGQPLQHQRQHLDLPGRQLPTVPGRRRRGRRAAPGRPAGGSATPPAHRPDPVETSSGSASLSR